jgi:hypothetical protein
MIRTSRLWWNLLQKVELSHDFYPLTGQQWYKIELRPEACRSGVIDFTRFVSEDVIFARLGFRAHQEVILKDEFGVIT